MNKVIPVLPCPDIKTQVDFYRQLGFTVDSIYTSPNPYAALSLWGIELHFYGVRKMKPEENSSMCFIRVDDVDFVYSSFIKNIRESGGKIPRTGIPRISRISDLKDDRRFTLTDLGGNTLYIGTPSEDIFFRTIENKDYQGNFAVLYDLQYSKEDSRIADNMLPRLLEVRVALTDLDRAKLLLVALDIQLSLDQPADDKELKSLLSDNNNSDEWERIKLRYRQRMCDL